MRLDEYSYSTVELTTPRGRVMTPDELPSWYEREHHSQASEDRMVTMLHQWSGQPMSAIRIRHCPIVMAGDLVKINWHGERRAIVTGLGVGTVDVKFTTGRIVGATRQGPGRMFKTHRLTVPANKVLLWVD